MNKRQEQSINECYVLLSILIDKLEECCDYKSQNAIQNTLVKTQLQIEQDAVQGEFLLTGTYPYDHKAKPIQNDTLRLISHDEGIY